MARYEPNRIRRPTSKGAQKAYTNQLVGNEQWIWYSPHTHLTSSNNKKSNSPQNWQSKTERPFLAQYRTQQRTKSWAVVKPNRNPHYKKRVLWSRQQQKTQTKILIPHSTNKIRHDPRSQNRTSHANTNVIFHEWDKSWKNIKQK